MRANYNQQTNTYEGQLTFAPNSYYGSILTIPLYLTQVDMPVRKTKYTAIDTIPTFDEAVQSDWQTHMLFMGQQEILTTTLSGYLLTPTVTVTQHGQIYHQKDPTGNGMFHNMSWADVIWAYISGKISPENNIFLRQDPKTYTDPFGNQYNTVVIQQFQADTTVWDQKETFQATLYLET